jgi:hypothetical protein
MSSVTIRRTAFLLAAAMTALGGCGGVQVRTLVAPDANFKGRTTFHLLNAKQRAARQSAPSETPNDPMLVNSITYRRVRAALRSALENRGYQYAEEGASLDVAYYATTRQKLDVQNWDYGYRWRRFPRERTEVTEYTEGTVIVDVVDPSTHSLLWRGQGRASVSDDPDEYAKQLEDAISAIVAKFPAPTP